MALTGSAQCLRNLAAAFLKDVASSVKCLCPEALTPGGIQIVQPTNGPTLEPPLVWATANDDCKKLEKKATAKTGPVCKAPDLRKKPVPPYQYGYCKDPEPELPKSCPPKATKRKKGPCCLNEVQDKKGGCRGR